MLALALAFAGAPAPALACCSSIGARSASAIGGGIGVADAGAGAVGVEITVGVEIAVGVGIGVGIGAEAEIGAGIETAVAVGVRTPPFVSTAAMARAAPSATAVAMPVIMRCGRRGADSVDDRDVATGSDGVGTAERTAIGAMAAIGRASRAVAVSAKTSTALSPEMARSSATAAAVAV